ncbi:unnamed protein product [Phyllotreta striolata]|uniref:Odorant receptor n=1 Tax=Phyllotreta striolata TaxID=444603 RepID=A0A9N9TJZ9_PHYSR|nr:unnamed protein product [Phyllotreta striolata]
MDLVYPKPGQQQITNDPLSRMKSFLVLHGFDGRKKYFWHMAGLLKALILLCRTTYACQTLDQPRKLAELVATYPIRFLAVVKIIVLFTDRKRVRYFYETISKEFWNSGIAGEKIQNQIQRRFNFISWAVLSHFSTANFVLIIFVAFPLVEMPEGKRTLPNIIWTPFDTNPSPVYEIMYVVLLWNLFMSVLGNGFYDATFIYSTQHLFVQFTLLKELIRNISSGIMSESSDLERFDSQHFQKAVNERLKICIEHHVKLLKYGKNIEEFSTTVMVPQLIMSYAALVINGYIISVDHADVAKTMGLINLTCGSVVQLVLYSLLASDIKAQSISVIDEIIKTDWYLFKAPIKRALIFMMMNVKDGIVITAGGMANVDNEVFVAVVSKAVSAITLLRALIAEEEDKMN